MCVCSNANKCRVPIWRSEGSLWVFVLSACHLSPWDQTQVITLGGRHRHSLSDLAKSYYDFSIDFLNEIGVLVYMTTFPQKDMK